MRTIIGNIRRGRGRAVSYLLAAFFAFAAAQSAWAAKNWTGNKSSDFSNSSNWSGTTGRRYFKKGNLTGEKRDFIYLSKDVTETSNTGLCFYDVPDRGYWRFQGQGQYTFDNSGNSNNYDQDLICIGYDGTGSSARFYAITLKTRHLTIGGDTTNGGSNILKKDMTGHLVLDDQNNDANGYLGPVNITATSTCDFYKGDLYATNANITCQGNMTLYDFTAEKTGGDWIVNGDLKIGNGGKTATLTQKNGDFTVNSGKWTRFESGSTCTLNLDGGTFKTKLISNEGATSASIVFNGGTLEANGYDERGLVRHSSINVTVKEGGATVNTGGLTPILNAPFNKANGVAGDLTVTGGGSATFSGMGDLAGALNVGDGTTLRWFDQDGTVSATCGFTSLALGAGSTLYIDGNATAVDALPLSVTTTATTENKATVEINFSAIPAAGTSFALFPAASADVFDVKPRLGGLELPHELSIANDNLVLTITADDYTWNGTQTNWGDVDAWTKGGSAATWADGNNAIFGTANATAVLAADASAAEARFTADATISGSSTLTVPSVSVVPSVSATISATTAGTLEKTGAGTLTLGVSRTEQTTVSEGTLAMANGATVDGTKLTLGTDPAKPVTFDYGGQTMSGVAPTAYLTPGADVTLTNGTFTTDGSYAMDHSHLPAVFTIAKDATFQNKSFSINTLANTTNTINIAGGTYSVTNAGNHWIMQKSFEGRLNINLTDGALMEFANEVYMLTCRDVVDNSTAYLDPSVYCMMNDSTFRVANGKSIRFGYDGSNKNPQCPTLVFAATNSVIDIGYGFYIGNNAVGENTAGSYTADFENCIITARQVTVYQDRPLNAVRFNNTRFVVNQASDWTLETAAAFDTMGDGGTAIKPMTIDAGGLVLDTNGKNCGVKADLQGTGALTKTGSGKLTIFYSQSSSAGLICEAGETFLNAGLTVARPVTVKNGATFTAGATAQSTLSSLTFEAGSTLNIDTPTVGVTPIAVTTLALPQSGTVTLTKNGGAFGKGLYPIFEKTGITAADAANLVPDTSELPYEWKVQGNALVLAVDTDTSGFVWTGLAGDGKMSTGGNWLNGVAPSVAGTALDFSGVITATTIIGDIDVTFGAVTMGPGVITFTGDKMAATSYSDTSKIAVGENARVMLDGNLAFSGSSMYYLTYKVDEGGAFVVTGTITISETADVRPYNQTSSGSIVAKGLVNNESNEWRLRLNNSNPAKWVVGEGGFSGDTAGYWSFNDSKSETTIKADADFEIDTWLSTGTTAGNGLTFDTTGWTDPSANYTITAKKCLIGTKPLTITGGGTFVCEYTLPTEKVNGHNSFSGAVTVTNTATLAINSGKKLTTGTITFAAGTTLEVPSTGVEMGAIAFSGEGTVTLKVVSDASLADGEYTLITSTADLPAGVATGFTVDAQTESRTCLVTLDNHSLRLAVGEAAISALPCIWTGAAGDGKMDTAGNWLNNRKPETVGAVVLFPSETATIDNNISGFAPSSITFGNGTGSVTIEGNAMTGVVAVTNTSSTASHTINVPVYFSGDIQVKQAAMAELGDLTKAHVTFAGGAYAALGYSIENGSTSGGYSRCIFGKYYLANAADNPWTATVQGSANRICLADNSLLYIPYAGKMTELYIGSGAKVDIGEMAIGEAGRVSYRNNGEVVVTNLTLSGTGDRTMCWNQGTEVSPVFKFERVETSMTGNWLYFSDGNGATKGVYYIGAGGLNFSSTSAKGTYCIGRNASNDAQTLRPWYSDFTIADRGNGEKSLVINRDVTFCTDDEEGTGRTITVDAIVQGNNSPTITVSGSGTLRINKAAANATQPPVTVTNTATLAIKPGASLTTSTMTLNSGTTLQVAQSGTVTLGGNLTFKDGAALGFNYTTRNEPVLDLSGKTVTFDEGETTNLVVKITTTDGRRAKGGKNVLTSGGKFAGVTVTLDETTKPYWVKGFGVENGEIVLDVKYIGTGLILR